MLEEGKKLLKLKKMQDEMKKQMESVVVRKEKNGMVVMIRGDRKIMNLEFDGVEDKELKDFLNDVMKELEKKLEKEFRSQSGELLDQIKA